MASVAIERARRCRLRVGSIADAECVSGLALLVFLDTYAADGMRADLAREALGVCSAANFAAALSDPQQRLVLSECDGQLLAFAQLVLQPAASDADRVWRPIGSGLDHAKTVTGHGEAIRQQVGGSVARRYDDVRRGESGALAISKPLGHAASEAGFGCQRMMHQRHHRPCQMQRGRSLGQNAKSQSVDDNRPIRGTRQEPPGRRFYLLPARRWKAVSQAYDVDIPIQTTQFCDNTTVVDIAAGPCREVARYRERYALGHNGASYHALARCDSEMVIRIAFRSLPSRPSLPSRAALASRS